jgi:protein-S-isoprenylcysteine O-methyltransferase Ste14
MSIDAMILRRSLVFVSALVYWAGVLVQARRVRKRIGRSANLKPRTLREKLLWTGWLLVILIWGGQPLIGIDPVSWRSAPWLLSDWSLLPGSCLIVLGYAGTLWCYAAMGTAWRIGIDQKEKNPLVTEGPFRIIRHPIYTFQIIMLIGALFLLPTLLSLLALVIHLACVSIKARDEESYLLGVHGEGYSDYLSRTGRFLPGPGSCFRRL